MENRKSEKGIISLFVLVSMLFLLIFVLATYQIINNRYKIQNSEEIELKEIYSKNYNEIENYSYAENDDIIPIYNINEFSIAGTGRYIQIKDKIYQCARSKSYILKENILVDIKEDLMISNIGFNDYKLYLDSYIIDKSDYGIYYYYENEKGNYWKNIAYQKFTKKDKELVKNKTYSENKFSIVDEYNYPIENDLTFMVLWSDKDGSLKNLEIESQNNRPFRLEDINVFREYYNQVNKEDGEFYIFVNIGNNI